MENIEVFVLVYIIGLSVFLYLMMSNDFGLGHILIIINYYTDDIQKRNNGKYKKKQ